MSYLNLMSPWTIGLSLYWVASMLGMYLMIRHSKHASISIMDFDLKVEIACAIICGPLIMPVILLMMIMYYFVGPDEDHEHADMGMYFQTALVLVLFTAMSVMSVTFHDEPNVNNPNQTPCVCKK